MGKQTAQAKEVYSDRSRACNFKSGRTPGRGPFKITSTITSLIIHMKKLLDSDWLRAVQFKCNTNAKSVAPVKLHIVILDNDWQKDNEKFCRPMISCKAVTKLLYGNCEKSFLECEKNGFKKHLPAIFLREFFHVCIINK